MKFDEIGPRQRRQKLDAVAFASIRTRQSNIKDCRIHRDQVSIYRYLLLRCLSKVIEIGGFRVYNEK